MKGLHIFHVLFYYFFLLDFQIFLHVEAILSMEQTYRSVSLHFLNDLHNR